MFAEARQSMLDPDTADLYPAKVMQYYQNLLESKAELTDSVKGRAGRARGWRGARYLINK